MEKELLEKLLLKTALSFMACDGDIDDGEVALVQKLASSSDVFGDIDVTQAMNNMLNELQRVGGEFLRSYFDELDEAELTEKEELELIKVAIDTINADGKVDYSEIKFFKIVRDKLSIDNDDILEVLPDIEEYLEQDIISPSYIANLTRDYLGAFATPTTGSINDIASDLDKIKKK